jgi:hypothetical protein
MEWATTSGKKLLLPTRKPTARYAVALRRLQELDEHAPPFPTRVCDMGAGSIHPFVHSSSLRSSEWDEISPPAPHAPDAPVAERVGHGSRSV